MIEEVKKSAVNRTFSRLVRLKFLNRDIRFPGARPREEGARFEFTVSVMTSGHRAVTQRLW